MSHKKTEQSWLDFESVTYTLFAVILVSTVFYLFYYDPVNYTRLISEDNFAEYGTSVSFAVAGILLLILSLKRGPVVRRIVWVIIGVVALLLSAEEISWGQRILGVETPYIVSKQNLQGEITLHNLAAFDSINSKLHFIASYLILAYLVFSIVVSSYMPRLEKTLASIGLPSIRIKLIPVFLLAPFFFIFYPTAKAEELGEFFLAIAVLMWAVDLFLGYTWKKRISSFRLVLVMAATLIVAAIMSAALTYRYPGGLTHRLNLMASRDYPERDMYAQAQELYIYIYENPRYVSHKTRANHARMLQQSGRQSEALEMLSQLARDLEARLSTEIASSDLLRKLGIVYILQLKSELANDYFGQAIEIDSKLLAAASSPDEKADLLWSIAKTLIEQGKISAAITNMERAIDYSNSSALRFKLEEQIKSLKELL